MKKKIQCVPILKGTTEYQDFVDILVSHIRSALSYFD